MFVRARDRTRAKNHLWCAAERAVKLVSYAKTMPKPISIVPYAKKSVLVCEPEDEERLEWLNKTLSKLGATKTRSIDRPGWVLPKENENEFKSMLLSYEKGDKPHRARRHSIEPEDHKIKHSRKKPVNMDHIPFKTKHFRPEDSDSKSLDEEHKSKKNSKTSYIEWEDAREYDSHHRDVESDNERSDSDDESSDDELIQAVLARKMKCESSQKEITEEEIKDSDEEDAVSYSRRLRHVYKVLGEYRKKIIELEQLIQSMKQPIEPNNAESTKISSSITA